MRRDRMLKLALVLSLVGLLGLSMLAYFMAPEHIGLSSVSEELGRRVVVECEVSSVSYFPDVTFLEVCDANRRRAELRERLDSNEPRCVKVVFFDLPSYRLVEGDLVEVEGKVKLYEGEVEIVAEVVKVLEARQ